ncbi:MAG: M24 family metallopeptidase [Bacillota bacterium]
MKERISRLRQRLEEIKLPAMLIMHPENRAYLSGFTGTAGLLLVTPEKAFLITDFRYREQAEQQAPACNVVIQGVPAGGNLARLVHDEGLTRLGFESNHITFQEHQSLTERMAGVELVPVLDLTEGLRLVKDDQEVEIISRAVKLADDAYENILGYLNSGVMERDVALELEYHMRKNGAQKASFEFIVASGTRGSLPHGVASEKLLVPGELVTMDFGAVYEGYCSDITRTVAIGPPTDRQKEIYQVVLEAQLRAEKAIRAGISCAEIDHIARDYITASGYGDNFGHALGHGVGMGIHEAPRLAAVDQTMLETGMIVTVEPGIYIEGWGGVRIEDMVLVQENGCLVLTGSRKDLVIIDK